MDFIIFAINFIFYVYYIVLVIRSVLPWFPHDRNHPLVSWVYIITEPLLRPVRAGLPPQKIGMDVSPFILIFFLWLAQKIIGKMLGA